MSARAVVDVPPNLMRLVLASFGLASAALVLAGYCFTRGDGPTEMAAVAGAAGGAVAGAARVIIAFIARG